MTILKMGISRTTGRRMVEVFSDTGRMVGCIYPTDDGSNTVHIVSEHFDEHPIHPSPPGMINVPGYLIKFKSL